MLTRRWAVWRRFPMRATKQNSRLLVKFFLGSRHPRPSTMELPNARAGIAYLTADSERDRIRGSFGRSGSSGYCGS